MNSPAKRTFTLRGREASPRQRYAIASALEDVHGLKVNWDVGAVDLEVRSSNVAARALYESLGFSETGLRPKYYATPDGREDAILMTLTLNHSGSAT